MSSPTIAPPASRAQMLARIAGAGIDGLPVPHTITLTGPCENLGYATVWLGTNDTDGVLAWVLLLEAEGGVTVAGPGLDGRRYPATGGSGSYRVYRATVETADSWQVNINCQVIS